MDLRPDTSFMHFAHGNTIDVVGLFVSVTVRAEANYHMNINPLYNDVCYAAMPW